ncbi:pyridoxamine 5'-phosphate oxidase family protein [Sphingopyxis panaciterrae]
MTFIDSVAALEGVIGKTPPPVNLKVIDHVDESARRWLAVSPLMFAGFGDGQGIAMTLGGGAKGFASAADPAVLSIPLDMLDDPALAVLGSGFGSLFLIPGIGETLRINGRVASVADGVLRIAVDECYGHCAKALIRSDFWSSGPLGEWPGDAGGFVHASRFMALATIDAKGGADLSPKGDPAGCMARMEEGRLWFADRPGNRRADSFRNIIAQSHVAAALLIPGSAEVALVRGRARLTTDEAARSAFAVRDKTPLLATRIDDVEVERRTSAAIRRAQLWPAAAAPVDIRPAKMFAEHVKLNRDKGLAARLAGAFVSVPGLMERGLAKDYKDNLY